MARYLWKGPWGIWIHWTYIPAPGNISSPELFVFHLPSSWYVPSVVLNMSCAWFNSGVFSLGTISSLDQRHLCDKRLFCALRMFSNLFGLYPLDPSGTLPSVTTEKCLQTLPNVPWGKSSEGEKPCGIYSTIHRGGESRLQNRLFNILPFC